jgi:hypothetical protein
MNSLTTLYLIELVGKDKFVNATGIVNLFRGLGCFIGPFIAGELINNNILRLKLNFSLCLIIKGMISERFGIIEAFIYAAGCFSLGFLLSFIISFEGKVLKIISKVYKKDKNNNNSNNSSDLNSNFELVVTPPN